MSAPILAKTPSFCRKNGRLFQTAKPDPLCKKMRNAPACRCSGGITVSFQPGTLSGDFVIINECSGVQTTEPNFFASDAMPAEQLDGCRNYHRSRRESIIYSAAKYEKSAQIDTLVIGDTLRE